MSRAVVVGASMSGLACAAALAERFSEVVVLERHALPAPGRITSLAPQSRMPHVLLAGGLDALERLQADFVVRAEELGAFVRVGDRNGRWWAGGQVRHEGPSGVRGLFGSRELLETALRDAVRDRPNVELRGGVRVEGIRGRAGRVLGVKTDGAVIEADLTVDASGRHTSFPAWLAYEGFPSPRISEVGIDLAYTGVRVAARPGPWAHTDFAVVQSSRALPRMGVALRAEGGTWQVALAGYFGDDPGISRETVLAFARSLPDHSVAEILDGDWLGGPTRYRFPASRRRHYDRLRSHPDGFVAVGDSIASFNPCYGQGMTSGSLQAEALGRAVDAGRRAGLGARAARACAAVVDNPWQIAAGGDFVHPRTTGRRPRGVGAVNRYLDLVFQACATDQAVNQALYQVQHLLAPPSALMRPAIAARVLRAAVGRSGSSGAAGVVTRQSPADAVTKAP